MNGNGDGVTEREGLLLNAVAEEIREQLAELNARQPPYRSVTFSARDLPPPTVVNEVPAPIVNVTNTVDVPGVVVSVDMAPVAAALARGLDAITTLAEMVSQLVQVLAAQPAPNVTVEPPAITVAAPEITVEAPNVTVEAPKPADRPKRKLTIRHDDGTVSTVTES